MTAAADAARPPPGRRWQAWAMLGAAAVLLLAWDASGLDLAAAGLFGDAHGFAWRNDAVLRGWLHDGGRHLAWAVLALQALDVLRPLVPGPSRAERLRWLAATLAAVTLVGVFKHASRTSCPWDLAVFGGSGEWISHWRWGVADGGDGHCFPSGHAGSAFAYLSLAFLLREHRPRAARGVLAAVLVLGAVFGVAQLMRGAHYPSHTLWSGWLCAAVCLTADAVRPRARAAGAWQAG